MNQFGRLFFYTLFIGLCALSSAQAAPDIQLNAILGRKIITTIDGEQLTLKEGDISSAGLELKEVSSRYAIFIWDGQEIKLEPSSRISTQFTEREAKTITIYQDASPHFFVSGAINGYAVQFMVDTGATIVSLNNKQADQLGLDWRNAPVVTMATAGGSVQAHALHLDEVTVQGVSLRQVEAVVMPQQVTPILLGMSFLRHFELTQVGSILTLKKKY